MAMPALFVRTRVSQRRPRRCLRASCRRSQLTERRDAMPVGYARTVRWRRGWRSWLAAATAVVVGVTALVTVTVTSASAATVDPNAWYVLVNRNSGKALDLYNMATNDGARITQWTRTNANNQQWQFVSSGGGFYRIRSRHSGKVLDVYNFS